MDAYMDLALKFRKSLPENLNNLMLNCVYVYLIICLLLYIFILRPKVLNFRRIQEKLIQKVLVITSHPDDECMFFAPTILSQSGGGDFVRLLCLSTGNYDGFGRRRVEELDKSCKILGIPSDQVLIENDSRLPDDPSVYWKEDDVIGRILPVVYKLQPNAVITFDSYGISGHRNHQSISSAVRKMCKEGKMPQVTRVYELKSTSIFRKYISFLDFPFTYLFSDVFCISSPWGIIKTWRAMYAHWSQLKWFRILYMVFSRYVIVNTLREIKKGNNITNHKHKRN